MAEQNSLKNQWDQLTNKYTNQQEVRDEIFFHIQQAYSSAKRHYHNLLHIETLLALASRYNHLISDTDSILFAIWFHDVVYSPTASDNEENSAELAKKHLHHLHVPSDRIEKIYKMILATKNHMDIGPEAEHDLQLFLDFDLKILGENRELYQEYMKQIRKEYKMIPSILYNPGRKKVLKKFLEKEYLYKTDEFRSLYERQAKANIQFEIDQL